MSPKTKKQTKRNPRNKNCCFSPNNVAKQTAPFLFQSKFRLIGGQTVLPHTETHRGKPEPLRDLFSQHRPGQGDQPFPYFESAPSFAAKEEQDCLFFSSTLWVVPGWIPQAQPGVRASACGMEKPSKMKTRNGFSHCRGSSRLPPFPPSSKRKENPSSKDTCPHSRA